MDEERSFNWAEKPLKLEDIWRIRTRLEIEGDIMELALLNLAIDCKLRSCDLLRMKVRDISSGGVIQNRIVTLLCSSHAQVVDWIMCKMESSELQIR